MEKECQVCGEPFKDGEKIVAVMLSAYKQLNSEVHFAIEQPTRCLEIFHMGCYDGPFLQDETPPEVNG